MRPVRVAIVEDERLIADELKHRLEGLGFDVLGTADTPAAALDLALSERPDLVIMDVRLKGGDGIDTAAAIRSRLQTSIVYLSAHSDTATIQRAQRTDPIGFLFKPFDERQLRATLLLADGRAEARRSAHESLHDIFESLRDLVQTVAADDRLLYTNRSWQRTLGYRPNEALALSWRDIVQRSSHEVFRDALQSVRHGGDERHVDMTLVARDGADVHVEAALSFVPGPAPAVRVVCRDVSEARRLAAAALRDPLTGCWNRRGLDELLARETARANAAAGLLGALLIDVDQFKSINDAHGHIVGDRVLAEVALRAADAVRAYDAVARIGGDEFVVVLPGVDQGEVAAIAERVRAAISGRPIVAGALRLGVSASIGVAVAPWAADPDPDMLIEAADISLYDAKSHGRNRAGAVAPVDVRLKRTGTRP